MPDELYALKAKIDSTANDVIELKSIMKEVAQAMRDLAVLETKHMETRSSVGRVHHRLDNEIKPDIKQHEKRIQNLEISDAKQAWIERSMWIGANAVILFVLNEMLK